MKSVGFKEGAICVRAFFLPGNHIGILDFPQYYSDVLLHPAQYSADEVHLAQEELNRWVKEGLFELWVGAGRDVWINGLGKIDSR